MWIAGLPVDCHDHGTMALDAQRHDSRQRAVDQPQAHALAGPHRDLVGQCTVDGHRVADAAGHSGFHGIAEAGRDLGCGRQSPIRQHPDNVAIDRDRLGLFDDQRAGHPAPGLLQAIGVRVVPEGPGIGRGELVGEALARPPISAKGTDSMTISDSVTRRKLR
jgi:hypothetical protein